MNKQEIKKEKLTIYFEPNNKKELKIYAAQEGKTMSEILEELFIQKIRGSGEK